MGLILIHVLHRFEHCRADICIGILEYIYYNAARE
jgi:hypothetical protein